MVVIYISSCSSELEGSVLRFRNVDDLLRGENDTRLLNILESISCMKTIARVNFDNESSKLIDFVTKFRMAQKHLTIINPKLNVNSLQNKTINFNVMLNYLGPGITYDI